MKIWHMALVGAALLSTSPAWAEARKLPIGACINIGNTLEIGKARNPYHPVTAADFKRIKAAGFQTVRIPVRWDDRSLSKPPYTVDPKWMDHVQSVVDEALTAGLNVILNSHHFQPIYETPLKVEPWHTAVWRQIAHRFKDYPDARLWFELENEPHKNFDDSNLRAVLDPALAVVRKSNPDRPVIYGGQKWSGIDSLTTLTLPDDPNVYPTFHYYEPFDFTHQGAQWVAPDVPPVGREYGTAADKKRLDADVAKIAAFEKRTGLIPFMGESGAYEKYIPTAQRVAYTRAVHDAFAPIGVDICQWAYANTFPLYDEKAGQWVPGMLEALDLQKR